MAVRLRVADLAPGMFGGGAGARARPWLPPRPVFVVARASGDAGNARAGIWSGSRRFMQRLRLSAAGREPRRCAVRAVETRDAVPVLSPALAELPARRWQSGSGVRVCFGATPAQLCRQLAGSRAESGVRKRLRAFTAPLAIMSSRPPTPCAATPCRIEIWRRGSSAVSQKPIRRRLRGSDWRLACATGSGPGRPSTAGKRPPAGQNHRSSRSGQRCSPSPHSPRPNHPGNRTDR